ncbi:MAG: hypothetical protein WBM44_09445, partial [Waterburya sp.]
MSRLKLGFITLVTFLLVVGTVKPVTANPISDFLNSITNQVNQIVGIFYDVSDEIKQVGKEADIQIKEVKGDLGLPDLAQVEASIDEELTKKGDLSLSSSVKTRVEVEAIQTNADSVLGVAGQKNAMESMQNVADSVQTISALENQASSSRTSQEVLKAIAAQQSQNAVINSNLSQSLQDIRQSSAFANRANAKLIKQNEIAAQAKTSQELQMVNTEMGMMQILQSNLY